MPRTKGKSIKIDPSHKGAPIRIKGGTYEGESGWLDESSNHTRCFFAVIIDEGHGIGTKTVVKRENVANHHPKPSSRFTSALVHVPELEKAFDIVAKHLALAKIRSDDPEPALYLMSKLEETNTNMKFKSRGKGRKAQLYYDLEDDFDGVDYAPVRDILAGDSSLAGQRSLHSMKEE